MNGRMTSAKLLGIFHLASVLWSLADHISRPPPVRLYHLTPCTPQPPRILIQQLRRRCRDWWYVQRVCSSIPEEVQSGRRVLIRWCPVSSNRWNNEALIFSCQVRRTVERLKHTLLLHYPSLSVPLVTTERPLLYPSGGDSFPSLLKKPRVLVFWHWLVQIRLLQRGSWSSER